MIIIIDGYNLLRAVFYRVKGALEKQRALLIKELRIYRKAKEHDIIVVFDGGTTRHASREVHGGVVVVYAGQVMSADDWIIEYVAQHKAREIVLVTRDRQIIAATQSPRVDVVDVEDFYTRLRHVSAEVMSKQLEQKLVVGGLHKYAHDSQDIHQTPEERAQFDALMTEAAMGITSDEHPDDEKAQTRAAGAGKKLSKVERKLVKKLGKL